MVTISFQEGGYPDWTYVRIDRRNDGAEARVLFDPDAYNHDEDTNKEIEKIINNEDEISDRMTFEYQFWTIHITEEKWYQIIDTLFNELHLLEWTDEYTDPEVDFKSSAHGFFIIIKTTSSTGDLIHFIIT